MLLKSAPASLEAESRRITKAKAKSFYLATLFLPGDVRRDVHVLYAYYRTVDDLVDERPSGWDAARVVDQLAVWRGSLTGSTSCETRLMEAVSEVAGRYHVPAEHLTMVLDGLDMDLRLTQIQTRAELLHYSTLVAGSVGMVMARVLGAEGTDALRSASDLGVAMQLTNVLRDVGEDLSRGRIYVPAELLHKYRCSAEALRAGRVTERVEAVLAEVADDARHFYRSGIAGIHHLPGRTRFSIYLAAILYRGILEKIESEGYDVFGKRIHLGAAEKCRNALPAYLAHRRLQTR